MCIYFYLCYYNIISSHNQVFLIVQFCHPFYLCIIFLTPSLNPWHKEEAISSLTRITPPEGAVCLVSTRLCPLVTANPAINVLDQKWRFFVLPDGSRAGHLEDDLGHHGHHQDTLQ